MLWEKTRLAIYVTLLDSSTKAEWYVVRETGSDGSDLISDGFCEASKLPLAIAESLKPLLSQRTAGSS